jgi:hypothetical protein
MGYLLLFVWIFGLYFQKACYKVLQDVKVTRIGLVDLTVPAF